MAPQTQTLEGMLTTLGQAHRDGAFAAVSKAYPWQAAEPRAAKLSANRFRWVRVAMPLAAAAAVAVVFVGPSLFGTRAFDDMAKDGIAAVQSESPKTIVDAEAVTTARLKVECDFNGDGVVDGMDIQAFIDRIPDANGDPLLQAERLQRCLLGS